MSWLLNPPFAQHLRIRLPINARVLGIAIVALSLLGIPLDLLSMSLLALPQPLLATYGFANVGIYALASGIALLANLVSLTGGWRLFRRHADGKAWVIYSLGLAVCAGIAGMPAESLAVGLGALVLTLLLVTVLYYLVAISQFPQEVHS